MIKVNVAEVKARLSDYLDRCARGERIVVCRNNRPIAELRPVETPRSEPRPIGLIAGRPAFEVPPAFFEPMSAGELADWEGAMPTNPQTAYPPVSRRPPRVAERLTAGGRRRGPRRRS